MPLDLKLNYDPTDLNGRVRPAITQTLGIRFPLARIVPIQ